MTIMMMTMIQRALSYQHQLSLTFELPLSSPKRHLVSQSELNDLVGRLELPKSKAELLGSRLHYWNPMERDVKVSFVRGRQRDLVPVFVMEGDLVYCNDIDGLMTALAVKHNPDGWKLVIVSSKTNVKAVLLKWRQTKT